MQKYQMANNGDKMLEMAQKALSFDPDEPEALVGWRRYWRSVRAIPIWTETSVWPKRRKMQSARW